MFKTSEQLAWLIRRHGIEMTHLSGGSHIGAILSVADIIAVLYANVLNVDASKPDLENRDRFILSKGHAGGAVYAALAETGFFDVDELKTHYQNGSRLSGHVSHHLPGIDFSTGSLGHGISAGVGMALAAKQDNRSHRIFVVVGDGECNEGSVWEAAQVGAHFSLDNLTVIVDNNNMQSLDYCDNTLSSGCLADKWKAFGWETKVINGHSHTELLEALTSLSNGRPKVVIAQTIKGKGVSFMQEDILWHYRFPHDGWEYDNAVNELHANMPEFTEDPYTPNGITDPQPIPSFELQSVKHILTETYKPSWFGKEI